MKTILVVGATGSIGRLALAEALRQGYSVRGLVRSQEKADALPAGVEAAIGDLTQPETLKEAVRGVDAVVFVHGTDGQGKAGAEFTDYGGVRNVLLALGSGEARIALMTAIGVTNRTGHYNESESHDWKRRAERLVRASGRPYTIVRPGWFDYNKADEHRLVFLQGDRRQTGSPADGVISRQQVAEVLITSVGSTAANRKTFELIAEKGTAQTELDELFAALMTDGEDAFDGVFDDPNQPYEDEPASVQADLGAVKAKR